MSIIPLTSQLCRTTLVLRAIGGVLPSYSCDSRIYVSERSEITWPNLSTQLPPQFKLVPRQLDLGSGATRFSIGQRLSTQQSNASFLQPTCQTTTNSN
ncbi:hypothetical protein CVS40_8721 [Lucilia cuprina]|nr:hypothetical protein CVS40_8721 [Lucilia cuprina]